MSSQFPEGFSFGCTTSSFQTEGAAFEDGRKASILDMRARRPDSIWGDYSYTIANDTYHRFEQDIALMGAVGLRAADVSISWSRVLPDGVGTPNPKGLDYYDRFIDALLEQQIEPWVMLYHWDLPLELFYRGGWLNRDIAEWFAEYTALVVERYSDRVKHWLTFTEPQEFITPAVLNAPLRELLRASHHVLLAHGRAVQAIRAVGRQPARVLYSPSGPCYAPASDSSADIEAARAATFTVTAKDISGHTWFSDPMFFGHYPKDAWELFGDDVPEVRDGDMEIISEPIDLYGHNMYYGTTVRATDDGGHELLPVGLNAQVNSLEWTVHPESMYWSVRFLYERYGKPVVITENGLAGREWVGHDGAVHDFQRIDFIQRHLLALERAIADGVEVAAYFEWTFLDSHELAVSYRDRFGLIHVDLDTLERTPKDSAKWYAEVIRTNGAALRENPLDVVARS